ncbi:MAG: NADH-quinone oxidoreductase subunit N [Solirubrobacterales bacterium]
MIFDSPTIDYAALSPIIALTSGLVVLVLVAVFDSVKRFGSALALLTLAVTAGLLIWQWDTNTDLVAGSLHFDGISVTLSLLCVVSAAVAVLLSIGDPAEKQSGRSDYLALLMGSVLGMVMLTQANNILTFFVALELLSIPLYALCATNLRKRDSLESGLKYLIIGSLGSATLLYGLALIYGVSGATEFPQIAAGFLGDGSTESVNELISDPLALVGVGMVAVGLAFKISIAPFHQWTPDVYQGAPTPITAFMAVATKAAAFASFIRFFLVALIGLVDSWDIMLAALAAFSMVVGNVGALAQTSLKRMLGYSGIAQAGYMLCGIVVATQDGISALVFYLAAYVAMNLAAFAVIVVHERQTGFSDSISSLRGLGRSKPLLAWPLTIAMLALAGLPPTAGFIGKLYLIEALVDSDWTWLGVMIAVGTMISLVYYLRVVAAVWMSPETEASPADGIDTAGLPASVAGAPAADEFTDPQAHRRWYLVLPAVVGAAATVFFGVIPQPLVEFAQHAVSGYVT